MNGQEIKKMAVFTSGGDSPGMNACVRAVVRSALHFGIEVFGIYEGYEGMIDGEIKKLNTSDVSNIIQRGGTILKSARSERFRSKEGRQTAYNNLKTLNIDAVVAIGGDGTFRGALEFMNTYKDIRFIGLPGTIDNDLYGTDFTIGYDSAINTVVDAIDKIRDTATSHNRLFFVEVMGRDAGFIALRSGIASGAESILIPETKTDIDHLMKTLDRGWSRSKSSMIVVVSEGDDAGGAFDVAKIVNSKYSKYDCRVTVLGHVQRGGAPSCMDRVLATRLGVAAVEALNSGKNALMIGVINKELAFTPFSEATKHHEEISEELLGLAEMLSI